MNCPSCNTKLNVGFEMAQNQFVAWCGNGPCKSIKANDGAFGKSEHEAVSKLIKSLEEKPDWNEE